MDIVVAIERDLREARGGRRVDRSRGPSIGIVTCSTTEILTYKHVHEIKGGVIRKFMKSRGGRGGEWR